jgi:hypothetical protein
MAAPGKGVVFLAMVVISVHALGRATADGRERRLMARASSDTDGWRIEPGRRRRVGGGGGGGIWIGSGASKNE